ncbi:hypothetical protein [Acuticoccus sp.]|uniref:hypothetical protein n=1 Tax=Acuticoccus sp. TaxID=1904378 RepID=UPI003B519364
MTDDLIYRIFIELAVLEGKRDPSGRWTISDADEMARLLERAFAMVERASAGAGPAPG